MALCDRLQRFLDQKRTAYSVYPHAEAFTAAEIAVVSHVPEDELAKLVVLQDDGGELLMAALPASEWVDLEAVTRATGRTGLRLAAEDEFAPLFPDCETGAMPPFGGLYRLPLYLDPCLARSSRIAFQAGNHHELASMSYADYERLARPIIASCLHRTRWTADV